MSLYDELGGGEAIAVALDIFYDKVMADPEVAVFFEGVDVERVKTKQKAFLSIAFGGEADYTGRGLGEAHARARQHGLDDERFDRFMGHFEVTLRELNVPADRIREVMDIAYGGRDEVLGRPAPEAMPQGD